MLGLRKPKDLLSSSSAGRELQKWYDPVVLLQGQLARKYGSLYISYCQLRQTLLNVKDRHEALCVVAD